MRTLIMPSSEPSAFLGLVVMSGNRRRLPEANVRRFRKRLRSLRDRWRAGTVRQEEVEQRVRSWVAHAAHAETWRLRRAIFRGGWFDPLYLPVATRAAARLAGPGVSLRARPVAMRA